MSRQQSAYIAMGGALALVSVASISFAMSAAPQSTAVPEPVPVQSGSLAPPPATPIPADSVVTGAAGAVAAGVNTAGASDPTGSRPVQVCGQEVDGWVRSESSRVATKKSALTVQVAAWRAGAAAGAYRDLVSSARDCGQVYQADGIDQFRTGSYTSDGQWAIGVRRFGDIMVVASVSSLDQDPDRVLDSVMNSANQELPARLSTVCVDPTSTTDKYLAARDPYSPDYNGYQREVTTSITAPPVFTKKEIRLVASESPRVTWRGPGGVAYAPWAPLVVPPLGTPISPDPATAPRGAAPLLVDPSKISPPNSSQPSGALGDDPPVPEDPLTNSVARAPALDVSGPGCGWEFTATVSPIVASEEIDQGARKAILDKLAKDTKKQGQTLVQTVAWPQERADWVAAAQVQANWNAYYSAVSSANAQTAKAKAAYDKSVAQWQVAAATGVVPAPAVP
jgi:hypothetical protein